MLDVLQANSKLVQHIDLLKLSIVEHRKSGILVLIDGTEQAKVDAYVCQVAIDELNSMHESDNYICLSYFMPDEYFTNYSKQQLVEGLNLKQPINLVIDDAVDELTLELEYSYKQIGMSRHMGLKSKVWLKQSIARQTANVMAQDMNTLLYEKVID